MFYTLIKWYESLSNTLLPSHEQYTDDVKDEVMSKDEYDHMVKL